LTFLTLVYKIYLDIGKEIKRRMSGCNDNAISTLGFLVSAEAASLPVSRHAFNPLTCETDLCAETPAIDARYRGFHVLLDYSGFALSPKDAEPQNFSEWNMAMIQQALRANGIRCVHSHAEVFAEGGPTPPGFTSVCLLDESHVSSHCYSDDGLLAIDIFTCGGKPQQTFAAARDIHKAVMAKLPGCKFIGSSTYRFPYHIA
jgi:S-adenosylmethionine decarboxylase